MYSRSYGSIESERRSDGVSIPADYNGSLYTGKTERTEARKKQEEIPLKQERPEELHEPAVSETAASHGTGSGLLERFSAEDIILFVLVFLLLKEDGEDHGIILAVILAILLL